MKKGRYRTTYAIWYLPLKDTNVNHNLKHHYLKLKLPFLNECKSDPCLQHFLKASGGLVSPCPEPFFCSWFHRHLILKKPWAYNCPVKRLSNPLSPSKRDQAREGKCTLSSVNSPEHHLQLPHPWDHTHTGCTRIHGKLLGGRGGFEDLQPCTAYKASHNFHMKPTPSPSDSQLW